MTSSIESMLSSNPQEHQVLPDTVRLMEKLHAEQVFSTPEASKQFLDSLTFDEFSRLLDTANGLERNLPKPDRGMKGSGFIQESGVLTGESVEYQPPQASDRVPLMGKVFQAAQRAKDPEDAAVILALSINAIHPYDDGNGRTSRLIYTLLQRGYNGTDEDKQYYAEILKNTEGRKAVNLDPSNVGIDRWQTKIMAKEAAEDIGYDGPLPTYEVRAYGDAFAGEYTPADLVIGPDISDEGRRKLHLSIADKNIQFAIPQILRTMHAKGMKPSEYTRVFENDRCVIQGDVVVGSLSEADIDDLYSQTNAAKVRYIENMIDMSATSLQTVKDHYRPKTA